MSIQVTQAQAEGWLREILGSGAGFRDGQWDAIEALVIRRQRALVVQRTGWGKSLVYFMATRLLRAQGSGPTLLVSPLLSLMRNQIQSAAQYGLRAETINSNNSFDHERVEADVLAGKLDLLLISPERLANDNFQERIWPTLRRQIGLLVIDEAHCISDWGHDFRPNYRRIMGILDEIPPTTPVLGTTATANDRVVADVAEILGQNIAIQRGPLTRDSLSLYVYPEPMEAATRLTLLSHLMKSFKGSGIIYCTTTRDCRLVAEWLQSEGHNVKPYYADVEETGSDSRAALEDQLMNNQVKALVSSVALGMGFDKADLHFVVHYQLPGNIISYYQQIGRAGRGIDKAYIVLMHGPGDEDIQHYFIDTAFPGAAQVQDVIDALQQDGSLKRNELQRRVNVRVSVLEKILTHLEVEGIINRDERAYRLLKTRTRPDYARWDAVTATRYAELEQMKEYIDYSGCLMHFIAEALEDPKPVERCGRCKNCTGAQSKFQPSMADVERAQRYLRQDKPLTFEPRKRFPAGMPDRAKTTIAHVNQMGLALCGYYDEGWGIRVREGRARGVYGNELVEASAEALRRYWAALPSKPAVVVAVPSLRRPKLVPEFAERLAKAVGLPYLTALEHVEQHSPQSEMRNSFQQAANVLNRFEIVAPLGKQAVLLIDDIADSKWTLTVIGDLLQDHGSGPVYPFALATRTTAD